MVVHACPEHLQPRVNLRIDGWLHRAIAHEVREYPDGRRALRLTLWPARRSGSDPRCGWFFWDPQAMCLTSDGTSPIEERPQPGDAIRMRPADLPDPAPAPVYEAYSPNNRPRRKVRVGGEWHDAVAFIKITCPDGRIAVQVRVRFLETDWPVYYWRTYWWDPDTLRPRSGAS